MSARHINDQPHVIAECHTATEERYLPLRLQAASEGQRWAGVSEEGIGISGVFGGLRLIGLDFSENGGS